jgi:hypothetical protein
MDEPKAVKSLNWVTLKRNVRYVAMLANPVATDHGVADRVIRVKDGRGWVVFLVDSNYGPATGSIDHAGNEQFARLWAEVLPSRWPPADPAQIANLANPPASRSIIAKTYDALTGFVTCVAGSIVIVALAMIVIAICWALSPQLTVGPSSLS